MKGIALQIYCKPENVRDQENFAMFAVVHECEIKKFVKFCSYFEEEKD